MDLPNSKITSVLLTIFYEESLEEQMRSLLSYGKGNIL